MKVKILGLFFAVCMTLIAFTAIPQTAMAADDTLLLVEEPKPNSTYSGVTNLRGWAVSINGIDKVELLVDGTLVDVIPSGGLRPDVGNSFPTYPNSGNSGFSMAFNYSNLSPGQHTFTVRAVDTRGNAKVQTVTLFTVRFDVENNFLLDDTKVNLNASTLGVGPNGRSISIKNMLVDGKTYNILLDWRQEAQGFAITQLSGP